MMNPKLPCGCGNSTPSKEDVEKVVREIEEEREDRPAGVPIEVDPDDIFAPRRVERREKVLV